MASRRQPSRSGPWLEEAPGGCSVAAFCYRCAYVSLCRSIPTVVRYGVMVTSAISPLHDNDMADENDDGGFDRTLGEHNCRNAGTRGMP